MRLRVCRYVFAAILWTAFLVSHDQVCGQSTHVFGIFYRQEFMQVGDFVFPNLPGQPAYWEGWARGFSAGEITRAKVTTSLGKVYSLTLDSEGAYSGGLADQFPSGDCSLTATRSDGTTLTVQMTQSAPAYPGTPKFSNLTAVGIKAGVDLKLEWLPGSDARSGDFVWVTIQASNFQTGTGWVFQTPWPGQPDALSGMATGVTVPGGLLKPNDMLIVKLISFRASYQQPLANGAGLALAGSAAGVMTTLNVPDAPQDNDVTRYRLMAGVVFNQEDRTASVNQTNGGWWLEASAWAVAAERLKSAGIAPPGSASRALVPDDNQILWRTNLIFNSAAELLAAAPPGAYRWTFNGVAKGTQVVTQAVTGALTSPGPWPAPFLAANWSDLQTRSFTNDVVVRWTAPDGSQAGDQIELEVVNADQNVVFRNPDYAAGDLVLPGATTELTIPADTLIDGEDYQVRLRRLNILEIDLLTSKGATGVVARCTETRFTIGTLVAPPLEILTVELPSATVGEDYLAQLEWDGGRRPCALSLVQGELSRGLSFESSGLIRGIPYVNGVFHFDVRVADSLGNSAVQTVSLTVNGTLAPLGIATTSLPDVGDGIYCILPLQSQGGAPPFRWSILSGKLPQGLELDPQSGWISGIAEEAGAFPLEVQLQDGAGQTQRRAFTVNVPSVIHNPTLRLGLAGPLANPPQQFRLLSRAPALSGQKLRLHLNTEPDELVTIQVSADLRQWQTLFTTNSPADGILEWSHPETGAAFYRACRGKPEPQYNPVAVNVTLDPASTTSALLTGGGLSFSLTNSAGVVWRLDVPPNAVPKDTPISMSLVQSVDGFPFEVRFLGGVSFAPEGLSLMAAATLTATLPDNLPPDTVGFAFQGRGADFHSYPCVVKDNTMTFPITHFSGVMGGGASGSDTGGMSLNTACNSQSSQEQWIAMLVQQGLANRSALWTAFYEWYVGTLEAHLKAAAGNDELLWLVTREFLAWTGMLEQYILGAGGAPDSISNHAVTLRNKGWKALARAYANAVNRSHTRCVTQFRPFQAVRMMKLAENARNLGLGQWFEDAAFFTEAKMNARYRRAFRFELQTESSMDFKGKKGGQLTCSVISGKCSFEALEYEGELQNLTIGGSAALLSENWHLTSSEGRVKPVVTAGKLIGVRLSISPNYPYSDEDPGRCTQGVTWNDPTEPEITCVFDAVDPVQAKKVLTKKSGWKRIPIPPEGGDNWYGTFRLAHAMDLVSENDAGGAAHVRCVKIEGDENWKYQAQKLFADATFQGPPKYAEGAGGKVNEDTTLRLFHAPLP
jgi:hypothetical protein